MAVTSFTEDTAQKTGQSARDVRRDAQRGSAIGTDALSKVVGTSLDKGGRIPLPRQMAFSAAV